MSQPMELIANFRYLAVYNELVARISQRQQSLILFVAVFSGLMTSMLALKNELLLSPLKFEGMLLAFPLASLALTLLNLKYEKLISILRAYLAELEQVADAHLRLPSLNSDSGRIAEANDARKFHDWTCGLMILSFNGVALVVYLGFSQGPQQRWVALGVAFAAVCCALAHVLMARYHYKVKA